MGFEGRGYMEDGCVCLRERERGSRGASPEEAIGGGGVGGLTNQNKRTVTRLRFTACCSAVKNNSAHDVPL